MFNAPLAPFAYFGNRLNAFNKGRRSDKHNNIYGSAGDTLEGYNGLGGAIHAKYGMKTGFHDGHSISYIPQGDSDKDYADMLRQLDSFRDRKDGRGFGINNPIYTDEQYNKKRAEGKAILAKDMATGVDSRHMIYYDDPDDFRGFHKLYNDQRQASGGESYNSFLRELDKLRRADIERFSKMPRTEYDKKQPQMSMMTQRARELQDKYKGQIPYKNKIDKLTARGDARPGFEAEQIDNIANYLRGHSEKAGQDILQRLLQKRFQDDYKTRGNIFDANLKKVLDPSEQDNRVTLAGISDKIGAAQHDEDAATLDIFSGLGRQKKSARDSTIKMLDKLGNQQHAYDELMEKGKEKTHDIEAALPYLKMNRFEQDIQGLKNLDPMNPEHNAMAFPQGAAALSRYGVKGVGGNTKHDAAVWDKSRVPSDTVLNDNLVAELTPEILESQYTAQRLHPGLRDDRKSALTEKLYGRKGHLDEDLKENALGNVVYKNTMKNAPFRIDAMDRDLKKAFKQRMNQLAHKYTRLNQYGSPQQIREAEEIARDLTEKYDKFKSAEFSGRLGSEQMDEQKRLSENRHDLARAGEGAFNQHNTILNDIQDKNTQGAQDWYSSQDKKNQKTKSYLDNLGYEYGGADLGGGFFDEFKNPIHESAYKRNRDDLMKKRPLSFQETLDLENVDHFVPFNKEEKASNSYSTFNKGSLTNPYRKDPMSSKTQYDTMRRADEDQSKIDYLGKQKENARIKKEIEDKQKKAREEAMRAAVEAQEELGYLDKFDLNNLYNAAEGDVGGMKTKFIEDMAKLLEKKTKRKFRFSYPDSGQRYENHNAIMKSARGVLGGFANRPASWGPES